jgi:hypothetical protein
VATRSGCWNNTPACKLAELTQIRRQKAAAHKAVVADLRAGNLENVFKRLDKLGMLLEMDADQRHEALATDYVAAVKKGKSDLVISPTHAEGERVTRDIRTKLKTANKLGTNEREPVQLKNLQWDGSATRRCPQLSGQAGCPVPSKPCRFPARGTGHGSNTHCRRCHG